MGTIGKKIANYTGKVTSFTMSEAGGAVNVEADAGDFGTILYTTTFGPPVDAAGETGAVTVRGQGFLPDGSALPVTGGGTWRKIGTHKFELKVINQSADGQRYFVTEVGELATRSAKGAIYELD